MAAHGHGATGQCRHDRMPSRLHRKGFLMAWNGISWGIETLGDYMQEPFTDPIHAHLVACLATLHMTAGLDVSLLRFHKEDPKTSHKDCPGSHIDKQHLIQEVHALIVSREA